MKKLSLLLLIVLYAPFAKGVTLDYNLIDPNLSNNHVQGVDIKRNGNGIYHLINYYDGSSGQRPRIERFDLNGNLVGSYTDLAWLYGTQLVPVSLQLDNAGNVWMLANLTAVSGLKEVIVYKLDKFLTNATVTNYSPYSSNTYERKAVGMELDGTTGLVITCNKDSVAQPSNNFMSAFKISLAGVGIWNYDYHLPLNFASAVKCMAIKSGKVYFGGLRVTQNWSSDAAIVCLRTTNGTLLWQSSYHYSTNMYIDQISGLAIDNIGNCYATGITAKNSFNDSFNNIMLKYTSTGVLSWAKLYAPTIYFSIGWYNDNAYKWIVLDNASNAYFLSTISVANGFKSRIGKYDSAGNLKWSKTIKSTLQRDEQPVALKISTTNNIYVATSVISSSYNNTQLYRYDTLGALKETDTAVISPVAMTLATSGSKILLSGYVRTGSSYQYALASFSQSPLRIMDEEDNTNKPGLTCYPSPAADFISIKTDVDMQNAQLTITNMNGSTIRHQKMEDGENTIPVGDLPNGIYVVMLSDAGNYLTKKFMVQH